MRRPNLVLATVALTAPLLTAIAPGTEAATEVRHFYDAVQFGGTADEVAVAVSLDGRETAVAGTTDGALPGQTHHGGDDVFVQTYLLNDHRDKLVPLRTTQLGGPGDDRATALQIDANTHAVAGTTTATLAGPHHGGTDGWLQVRSNQHSWSRQIGGPDEDAVLDVAVGARNSGAGVIFAAGYRTGDEGRAAFVQKYSSDGDLLWEGEVAGDAATRLSHVHHDDTVYVVEESQRPSGLSHRLVALKTSTGDRKWETPWAEGGITALHDVHYLDNVVVLAGGQSVAAYAPNGGALQWRTDVFAGLPDADVPHHITAGDWAGGDAFVVSVRDEDHDGETLVALSLAGRRRWVQRMPDDFEVASMEYTYKLLVAGSTGGDLGGTSAGGTDAVIARFATYQPDVHVTTPERYQVGDDWYGRRHQRLVVPVSGVRTTTVELGAQNDGEAKQRLRVRGCGNHDGYRFTYRHDGTNVTSAVVGGIYRTAVLRSDWSERPTIAITPQRRTTGRTTCRLSVTSVPTGEVDRFKLVITRP